MIGNIKDIKHELELNHMKIKDIFGMLGVLVIELDTSTSKIETILKMICQLYMLIVWRRGSIGFRGKYS